MKLLTFLEATSGLSHIDAMTVIREIETGRGGIAELVGKKPALTEMSQERLRQVHGDIVPLFRVLALPEGKEMREEGIVSTSTDWNVAVAMGRDQPGVVMNRGRFTSIGMVLLRYDTPIERCLADVGMLLEMAVEAIGGIPPDNIKIKGRRGGEASIAHLIRSGINEEEVIADVSGIEPVMLNYPSHVNGQKEMDMIRGLAAGDYNSPDEYMAHRIANKGDNEYFSDEEEAELKAMYADRAPVVKQFIGREGMTEELYHATTHDIDEFRPLSHFGTPKAAAKRAAVISKDWSGPEATRTYRANMPLKNPVMMWDYGNHHDTAMDIARGIETYYYEINNGEKPAFDLYDLSDMVERWNSEGVRQHDEANRKELIAFLKDAGYDGIAYQNTGEGTDDMSYMNLDPVVAESATAGVTINYNGEPKLAVKPERAGKDVLMMLPTKAMDASFAQDSDFYVGPDGSGAAIGKRYAGFQQWIEQHEGYEVPEVYVHTDGKLSFTNGRHRYAVLRDAGIDPMPVAMARSGVPNAEKFIGGVIRESLTEMADPQMIRDAAPRALAKLKLEITSGIDDAHEDFETETGVEDGDPKWEEKFAIWKEGYAQRRIGRAIGAITKGAEYRDGKMVVHRMLSVNDPEKTMSGMAEGGLGQYWTWDKNYAESYAGHGGNDLIMTGLVDPIAIDWVQTILMNAHPAAEEELEITIPEGTPIKLMNVDADGRVVDPSMYPQGRVLTASLGESQLDDDYARGYNEGQLEGIKAGHEWYKNNMGKADKEPPEFDNFHVQRGRVTKANGYAKAYAYGYQDGYYTMQTGGDAEHLIGKIQAKLSEGMSVQMSSDEMIQYLRQHHDANLHQDYIDHIQSFGSFVLRDIPIASIANTELAGLEQAKVAQYKDMDFGKAPPIVMGGGHILDGYHRVSVAKALGIQSIKGYVGLES